MRPSPALLRPPSSSLTCFPSLPLPYLLLPSPTLPRPSSPSPSPARLRPQVGRGDRRGVPSELPRIQLCRQAQGAQRGRDEERQRQEAVEGVHDAVREESRCVAPSLSFGHPLSLCATSRSSELTPVSLLFLYDRRRVQLWHPDPARLHQGLLRGQLDVRSVARPRRSSPFPSPLPSLRSTHFVRRLADFGQLYVGPTRSDPRSSSSALPSFPLALLFASLLQQASRSLKSPH